MSSTLGAGVGAYSSGRLKVGQIMKLEIVLEIGAVTDQAPVADIAPRHKNTKAGIKDLLKNQRTVALPLDCLIYLWVRNL